MRTILIVLSEPKNIKMPIYSMLIKKFEDTKYSHVSMHFRSESLDRTIIYEAVGPGVRFIGNKLWEQHASIIESFEISVTEEQYVRIMQHCIDTAGMKYGMGIAFGMALAKFFSLKENPFADPDKKVCSKAIGELLLELGYMTGKSLDLLDPEDTYEILSDGIN